jgi:exodeoxyribonuclease-1
MDVKKTFLFYDIETTGLNKCFDQVLQFAAIRTDLNLNELSRDEIRIRLNPDVIPTPKAILTHRIPIAEMLTGESELTAIKKIHHLLNTPGTISIGYNTLGFDDEFLRFSFYRNLLPPYTHQYQHQCSRMDLYPMVALYYLLKPNVIKWPQRNDKISLKLEDLAHVNQLTTDGQAHHAMTDVKACVALAKKLMTASDTWQQAISYFDRNTEQQRHQQFPTFSSSFNRHREAIVMQGGFGAELNFQAPAIELGQHRYYKNQTLWLRLDQENLASVTADNIPTTTFAIRKRNAEPPILLPLQYQSLSTQRSAIVEKNKNWLQQNNPLFQQICAYHLNYTYPKIPDLDIDAALYESGFPSSQEEFLFQRFHSADLAEKQTIAASFPNLLHRKLAIRCLGRHDTAVLSTANQQEFAMYLQSVFQSAKAMADYRGQPRLMPAAALQQIAELNNQNLDVAQQQLLTELAQYLNEKR